MCPRINAYLYTYTYTKREMYTFTDIYIYIYTPTTTTTHTHVHLYTFEYGTTNPSWDGLKSAGTRGATGAGTGDGGFWGTPFLVWRRAPKENQLSGGFSHLRAQTLDFHFAPLMFFTL